MELEENREIYRKELEKLERILGNFLREESDIYTFEYEYKSIYKAIKDNISEIKKCRSISYIKKILAYKIVTIFNGQMNHNLSLLSQSDRKFADEQSLLMLHAIDLMKRIRKEKYIRRGYVRSARGRAMSR